MSLKKEFTFKGCYIIEDAKSNYKQIMEEYLLKYLKQIGTDNQELSDNNNNNVNIISFLIKTVTCLFFILITL